MSSCISYLLRRVAKSAIKHAQIIFLITNVWDLLYKSFFFNYKAKTFRTTTTKYKQYFNADFTAVLSHSAQ